MLEQELAIAWAQWRSLVNYYPRASRSNLVLSALGRLLWFGGWAAGAAMVFALTSQAADMARLAQALSAGLAGGMLYWQTVPIFVATAGVGLDLKRLLVYPIPPRRLFPIEVLLRATSSVEMLVVMAALFAGLAVNRAVPLWATAAIPIYVAFNLLVSTGLRDLLMRLFARKVVREIAVFLLVIVATLPQVLLVRGRWYSPGAAGTAVMAGRVSWPWVAAARLAVGRARWFEVAALLAWTVAAWLFARWQFGRTLVFDAAAAAAAGRRPGAVAGWREGLYRLPSRLLADPLGAMVEKEIRFLSRAPRFRLLFLMGFTFGLLIWMPFLFANHPNAFLTDNFLTLVSLYAVLCLGDVVLWNTFGFDRAAVQNYYLLPVKFSTVLVAKNLAGAFFIGLEIAVIAAVCALLRFPVTLERVVEAFVVALVYTVFAMALGNLSSTHYPRAVDAGQSWRSGSGNRIQFLLLTIFPAIGLPIGLAYLARYAFRSLLAFYGVLGVDLALAAIVYWVALDSAAETAVAHREQLVGTLAGGAGPLSSS